MALIDPPPNFITISQALQIQSGQHYDVVGICGHYFDVALSRGTDFTIKFSLIDPTTDWGRSLSVRFFKRDEAKLPKIQANGDVLILRRLTNRAYQGSVYGLSNATTSWIVLSGSTVIESTCEDGSDIQYSSFAEGVTRGPTPSIAELKYAKYLVTTANPTSFAAPPKSTSLQVEGIIRASGGTPTPTRGKFRLLQELKLSKTNPRCFDDGRPAFADLFGEVRRIYKGDQVKVEVFLTDYTTNNELFKYSSEESDRDGDEHGYLSSGHSKWPGPWGQMSILICLWDGHAVFANSQLHEGDIVLVKNCHIKYDPVGSTIEAACRGESDDRSRVNVVKFQPHQARSDDRLKELLQRKREYEKQAMQQGLRIGLSTAPKKQNRTIEQAIEATPETPAGKSAAASRQAKRKRAKASKKRADIAAAAKDLTNTDDLNPHVRCENHEVKVKNVDAIMDTEILRRTTPEGNIFSVPFQNCRYKVKARVVDFWPHDIADFCIPRQDFHGGYEMLSDVEESGDDLELSMAQSNPSLVRWEWRFMLVIEDATPSGGPNVLPRQMPLLVAGNEGDCLLNESAFDMRSDPEGLAKIREKLFILWGDLEERKAEASSQEKAAGVKARSKPFECFVSEYGVPLQDSRPGEICFEYQRMFKIFGTTI